MHYFLLYLLIVNLIGIMCTALDKRRARRGGSRIPEKRLFLLCALGGCPGIYAAMRLFRHKTLHKRFMWGIPLIFMLQIAAAIVYFYHY